jgi:hypothetical protein
MKILKELVTYGPFGCSIFKKRIQFLFGARISRFDILKKIE